MEYKQTLTKDQALQKVRQYCVYQERAHKEVKEKLYGFGLHKKEVEEAMSQLIEENYLNEERFAIQFAGGRFRIKHWGRMKIKNELRQKQVSEYCIKKALASIDEGDYKRKLKKLFAEKLRTLSTEKNSFVRNKKLQDHLLQKGYESEMVRGMIGSLI